MTTASPVREEYRTLVTTSEGIGDEILYAGGLPSLDGAVTLEADPRLWTIFEKAFPEVVCLPRGRAEHGEISRVMSNRELPIPFTDGYLKAPESTAAKHWGRVAYRAFMKKSVGLSWFSQASPAKSATLHQLAALFTPDRFIVNLQYGDTTAERRQAGIEMYTDPDADPLVDMNEYFGRVAACDVVVTTSSTCLHVAGALGVKAFLLLPNIPGPWYWEPGRLPYRSVHVCRGEGEQWVTQALDQALKLI